jgi:ABC-type transporter Mla MlaB component
MAALPASTTVFTIRGPLGPTDLPGLCARLRDALATAPAEVAFCDVDDLVEPDLLTVDALARLQLAARRMGCSVWLRDAPPMLHGLLAFAGLDDAIPSAELRLEVRRQTEQREQALRVEEEGELDDAAG